MVGQHEPTPLDYTSEYVRIVEEENCTSFKIYKGKIHDKDLALSLQPILGTSTRDQGYMKFTPIVPFESSTPYTLICGSRLYHFEVSQPIDYEPLKVNAIYPGTPEVPANILKWYIEFSRAVNPVKIYDHISFLDQDGNPIDRSILNISAGLLSPDGTLLTVWIEPGRQKQLLGPNQRLGSVFEPHQQYTLEIDSTLKDNHGFRIVSDIRYLFTTIEADRTKPSVDDWSVDTVHLGSKEVLSIDTKELIDYGSLLDAFRIRKGGQQIDGVVSYDSNKKRILFSPEEAWQSGLYSIEVDYQLEDLAGNNLHHLFDRPIEDDQPQERKAIYTLSFTSK